MQVLHRQSSHASQLSQQMSAAAFPIASVVASVASATADSIAEMRAVLPEVLKVSIWSFQSPTNGVAQHSLLSGLSAACLCSMASMARLPRIMCA